MRFFLVLLLLVSSALLLVGLGHYLVLRNLSQLLAKDEPKLKWEITNESFKLKTGAWTETLNLRPPLRLTPGAHGWRIAVESGSLNFNFKPHLKIYWEESPQGGRKSRSGGEY